MLSLRSVLIWLAVVLAVTVPLIVAAQSPLLAWRDPIYILGGFAGIAGFACLLVQPLLVAGDLPGVSGGRGRRAHRWIGSVLLASVALHIGGLWITSPPDVIDALLLVSPTPFAVWGVLAMWAIAGAAASLMLRKRVGLRTWRRTHATLVVIAAVATVLHAVQIEGTMGTISKWVLSILVLPVLARTIWQRRIWRAG